MSANETAILIALVAASVSVVLALVQITLFRYRDRRRAQARARETWQGAERLSPSDDYKRRALEESKAPEDLREAEDTGSTVSYSMLTGPKLTIQVLADHLREAGLEHFDIEDDDTIDIGISLEGEDARARFRLSIDRIGGVVITSRSVELDPETGTSELFSHFLELNAENKVGTIGLRRLDRTKGYRVKVDYYLNLWGQPPRPGVLKFTFFAMLGVHKEVRQAVDAVVAKRTISTAP
jgi:Putative bacterial sensory transduction regulator